MACIGPMHSPLCELWDKKRTKLPDSLNAKSLYEKNVQHAKLKYCANGACWQWNINKSCDNKSTAHIAMTHFCAVDNDASHKLLQCKLCPTSSKKFNDTTRKTSRNDDKYEKSDRYDKYDKYDRYRPRQDKKYRGNKRNFRGNGRNYDNYRGYDNFTYGGSPFPGMMQPQFQPVAPYGGGMSYPQDQGQNMGGNQNNQKQGQKRQSSK